MNITIEVLEPTFPEAKALTKDDVWGAFDSRHRKIHNGMIVARTDEKCPVFGDVVPFKSVTVVGPKDKSEEIAYWLEYVHGCDCIAEVKDMPDNKIAFRSDYMAW